MERKYILYPEAKRKLAESGLSKRLAGAIAEDKIDTFIGTEMLVQEFAEMGLRDIKKSSAFKRLRHSERDEFYKTLVGAYEGRKDNRWEIKHNDDVHYVETAPEDIVLLTGERASGLLYSRELFNYRKFGFSSITELTGTLGAAMETAVEHTPWEKGLAWETVRADGRTISSVITGDFHYDLRIFQHDVTPYEVKDPSGSRVHYRPLTENDTTCVYGYHSTEGQLLATILKYFDQTGQEPDILKDNAKGAIEWTMSLGQTIGATAQHFGNFDTHPALFFTNWDHPMPRLDERYNATCVSTDSIYVLHSEGYGTYIGPKNELILPLEEAQENHDLFLNIAKKQSVTFVPEDADNLVKGLLYQAAKGLGRTSARQLVNILRWRFSPNFGSDNLEMEFDR